MRKQVQKERCTKIMLTKCKAVCHLYDKVQLAAAKMLDAEPAIFQFECNVPILCNDIPANDLNLPSETYTTDFVLHYDDGHTAVREAVFRSFLSRPSVAEKMELSRRYWQQQGISDWGIIRPLNQYNQLPLHPKVLVLPVRSETVLLRFLHCHHYYGTQDTFLYILDTFAP